MAPAGVTVPAALKLLWAARTAEVSKVLNEGGELKIMVRSKMTAQPDMLLLIHSDAAKSIHNYLCILFDKWEGMVKTREKWEVNEARTKGRK